MSTLGPELPLPGRLRRLLRAAADRREGLAKLAGQVGADGYLSKSHGLEALGEKVDELVESIIW